MNYSRKGGAIYGMKVENLKVIKTDLNVFWILHFEPHSSHKACANSNFIWKLEGISF